jgi:hypothetical protein
MDMREMSRRELLFNHLKINVNFGTFTNGGKPDESRAQKTPNLREGSQCNPLIRAARRAPKPGLSQSFSTPDF